MTSSIFILIAYQFIKNKNISPSNKLLVFIGNYSFGIYISHCMIITILKKIIPCWPSIPYCINSFIVLAITSLFIIVSKMVLGDKISKYFGLY